MTTTSTAQPIRKDLNAMSYDELKARVAELEQAEKERPKKAAPSLGFKVSAKGAVSVYGLSSIWPVTLYKSQWARLFEATPRLQSFITENAHLLKEKGE